MKLLVVTIAFACLGAYSQATELPLPAQPYFLDRLELEPKNDTTKQSCTCGHRNGRSAMGDRIVGGVESGVNEFPWRVALFNQRGRFFCTASLIDLRWVMTAAHCTKAAKDRKWTIIASIGDHDLESTDETKNQLIRVKRVVQHEKFSTSDMDNDIALLELSKDATASSTVSPVCLPYKFRRTAFTNETITASGWGVTKHGGTDIGEKLRKADFNLITNQKCSEMYKSDRIEITPNMICAYYYKSRQDKKDTCQGDSGGSIDYLDPASKTSQAVGIASFGIGCAQENKPGIYARVANYLDWIETNTGRTFCGRQ